MIWRRVRDRRATDKREKKAKRKSDKTKPKENLKAKGKNQGQKGNLKNVCHENIQGLYGRMKKDSKSGTVYSHLYSV
jgi:hypothetical protein